MPEDLLDHDCINFNFRRAAPDWPFRMDGRDYSLTVKGSVETNNGDGEEIHVVFMGGPHVPARVRCLVDYLVESFR